MIKLVVESGDYEEIHEYVFVGLAEDQELQARRLLMDDLWEVQLWSNFSPAFNPPTWAALKALFEGQVLAMVIAAIDWATTGSTGTVTTHEISAALNKFNHKVYSIPVFTDAEVLMAQVSVYGLDNAEGLDFQGAFGLDIPAPSMQSGQQAIAGSLDQIARALNQIARTSRVTWINNEGGFADLVSGDIVTP